MPSIIRAPRALKYTLAPAFLVLLHGCDAGPAQPDLATLRSDGVPAPSTSMAENGAGLGAVLAQIRSATAPYHRSEVASDEGFFPASGCVAVPGLGGMGFHYLDMSRLGDAIVDPGEPEILLYEPRDGKLRLVGVEFMVMAAPWDAGHQGPPSLLGVDFAEHRGADRHGIPFDHYDLHVWSWRHNPSGLTAPFNPKVSC